jgi:hypothetical protein
VCTLVLSSIFADIVFLGVEHSVALLVCLQLWCLSPKHERGWTCEIIHPILSAEWFLLFFGTCSSVRVGSRFGCVLFVLCCGLVCWSMLLHSSDVCDTSVLYASSCVFFLNEM